MMKKVYNITDILLSMPSSSGIINRLKQPAYHYDVIATTKEPKILDKRYYIYSIHQNNADNVVDDIYQRNNVDRKEQGKQRRSTPELKMDRKQVSRNISLVLENLLKSYENSQLPTHGLGKVMSFIAYMIPKIPATSNVYSFTHFTQKTFLLNFNHSLEHLLFGSN